MFSFTIQGFQHYFDARCNYPDKYVNKVEHFYFFELHIEINVFTELLNKRIYFTFHIQTEFHKHKNCHFDHFKHFSSSRNRDQSSCPINLIVCKLEWEIFYIVVPWDNHSVPHDHVMILHMISPPILIYSIATKLCLIGFLW